MNQKMYKWRYLSFTFLVLLLTACIIVPTGSEVKSSDISNFRPGFTTKYEVLEKLGEPNILNEDRFSVYQLSEDTYSMFIYIVIGGGHKHWAGEIYNLTISYDARDVEGNQV